MREHCLRIILVRHGKPQIDDLEKITGSQYADWLQRYDEASLDRYFPPPEALLRMVDSANYIMTSSLKRSVESAKAIAPKAQHHVFLPVREARLPVFKSLDFVLPARMWINLTGCAWFFGWSAQVESLQQVSQRANLVTEELIKIAKRQGSVLLVGHGIINLLIAKNLRFLCWQGPLFPNREYWGASKYLMTSKQSD
jgi:broad specificity phosphatase PhoE